MPIRRFDGSDVESLAKAVAEAEKSERVLQVIGQFGSGWALLTESRPARPPQERRNK